jgi:hypothetical protein
MNEIGLHQFIDAAKKIVASGGALLNAIDRQTRIEVCGRCSSSLRSGTTVKCTICGCNMNIKARFTASKCPLDKWDKPEE